MTYYINTIQLEKETKGIRPYKQQKRFSGFDYKWNKAINDTADTLESNSLFKDFPDIRKYAKLTGGCFASLMVGEEVKDYDIFLTNEELMNNFALYAKSLGLTKNKVDKPSDYEIIYISNNAVTFKNLYDKKIYQIITRYSSDFPWSVFDYVHCQAHADLIGKVDGRGYESINVDLVLPVDFIKLCELKKLRFTENASLKTVNKHRLKKFLERGWTLETEQDVALDLLANLEYDEKKARS